MGSAAGAAKARQAKALQAAPTTVYRSPVQRWHTRPGMARVAPVAQSAPSVTTAPVVMVGTPAPEAVVAAPVAVGRICIAFGAVEAPAWMTRKGVVAARRCAVLAARLGVR